jgi:hypothetical protein
MENAWDVYTPGAKPDYRHSPLLAESFKGLPPTRESALIEMKEPSLIQYSYPMCWS